MSGPFANPSNGAFQGGARFGIAPPTGASGTLAPPGSGSSVNPLAGVSVSQPNYARNNEGSNIRIPQRRVVPVSSPNTALPAASLDQNGVKAHWPNAMGPVRNKQSPIVMESEDLGAGRLCFIRGNRQTEFLADWKVDFEGPLGGLAPGNSSADYNAAKWAIPRTVGNGIERQEQLCSFEYLERYFVTILRRRTIAMGAPLDTTNYKSGLLGKFTSDGTIKFGDNSGPTIGNMPDIANNQALLAAHQWVYDDPKAKDPPKWAIRRDDTGTLLQGIFTHDIHPFLRGKGIGPSKLVKLSDAPSSDEDRGSISRLMGDEVADAALYDKMREIGLLDWLPDGIVLSKDHVGPDQPADDSFDARLGQLFNVAVQGPAICTSYAGNYKLKTLPGDKVFVLILADVHWDTEDRAALNKVMGNYIDKASPAGESLAAYFKERKDQMPNYFSSDGYSATDFFNNLKGEYAKTNQLLTNFRIRLSTSSEMVHTSGVDIKSMLEQGNTAKGYRVKDTERMGLRIGKTMGEYIVGGFCIGTVLDSAASRAALPGQFAVKSDTATYALNVYVKTEWWSGDKLYRCYCDVGKTLEARYDREKETVDTMDKFQRNKTLEGLYIAYDTYELEEGENVFYSASTKGGVHRAEQSVPGRASSTRVYAKDALFGDAFRKARLDQFDKYQVAAMKQEGLPEKAIAYELQKFKKRLDEERLAEQNQLYEMNARGYAKFVSLHKAERNDILKGFKLQFDQQVKEGRDQEEANFEMLEKMYALDQSSLTQFENMEAQREFEAEREERARGADEAAVNYAQWQSQQNERVRQEARAAAESRQRAPPRGSRGGPQAATPVSGVPGPQNAAPSIARARAAAGKAPGPGLFVAQEGSSDGSGNQSLGV